MVDPADGVAFPDCQAWRRWLEEHHASRREVWMLCYKVATGVPSVRWKEAVPEALCFGWIDGLLQPIDERTYLQRWTPRRPGSKWSKINVAHVERLTAAGLMAPAGLAAVEAAKVSGAWEAAYTAPRKRRPPDDLKAAIKDAGDTPVAGRFSRLSVRWHDRTLDFLDSADDIAERERRVRRVVESLRDGTKPDLG